MWHFYNADYIYTLHSHILPSTCFKFKVKSHFEILEIEKTETGMYGEKGKKRKTDREMEEERERIKQRQSGRVRVKIQQERLCVIMNIIHLYVHVSMALAY